MSRQTSSLFLRNANVCSGLLGEKGLNGYDDASVSGPVGRRSTKLGVNGNTRYVDVPVLSLFEIPRWARLWTTFEFTLTWKRAPSDWSRFARTDCFSYPVFFAMPPSCFTRPDT